MAWRGVEWSKRRPLDFLGIKVMPALCCKPDAAGFPEQLRNGPRFPSAFVLCCRFALLRVYEQVEEPADTCIGAAALDVTQTKVALLFRDPRPPETRRSHACMVQPAL